MYGLSDMTAFILNHVVRYRRKVILDNLFLCFPDKSINELKKTRRAFYRHFCDIFLEAVKLQTISKKNLLKRIVIKNPELFDTYFNDNKSIILYSAHFGNWEYLAALPFYTKHQLLTFYHPQTNTFINDMVRGVRERFGIIAYPSESGFKAMSEYNRNQIPTLTLMLGDQRPKIKSSIENVVFFNQETAFLVGPDRIAKKLNQVLVYPHYEKVRRGFYTIELRVIEENPKQVDGAEIIECFASNLEASIRKSPHMWLWSHRRWKKVNRWVA